METTTLQVRQKELGTYLMKGFPKLGLAGWSARGAAAACGNATQENLCRPVTIGAKDHGSDGIMQWRLSRLTNMQNYCVKNFGRWDTLEAQAAFLMYEMKTEYAKLYADLMQEKYSIDDLTADICWQFERPAKTAANLTGRIIYAKNSYALLAAPKPSVPIAKSTPKTAAAVGVTAAVTGVATVASSHAFSAPSWVIVGLGLAGAGVAIAFIVQHVSAATKPIDPLPPTNGAQS